MQVEFPLALEICEDTSACASFVRDTLKTCADSTLVLTGPSFSLAYCNRLLELAAIRPGAIFTLTSNSIDGVYELERCLRGRKLNRIFASGGGRVADFAKRLAYIGNLPLLLAPTIIANDGLISPISVLSDQDGRSVSLAGKMPDDVVIDLSVVRNAPAKFLVAAACDLVTNISATNDWRNVKGAGEDTRVNHLALQFSRMAAYGVIDCRSWDLGSSEFLRSIVSGQILSGVAMAVAGSSRPCSGSEHLISHALDHWSLGGEVLHGEKVGIASRLCLFLQNQYRSEIDAFFKHFGVQKELPGCEGMDRSELSKLFATARRMRPGRKTILDVFSDAELVERYFEHLACVESSDAKSNSPGGWSGIKAQAADELRP
jgi:glycerol-1-phosphate dehydrogenase [NAD(P)+]